MKTKAPSTLQRFIKTIEINKKQLRFGSYAAELSFYILWSLVPLLLALANVVALLPFNQQDFMYYFELVIPAEVAPTLVPIMQNYLTSTSSSLFSISLIISLWPASNVFNTLQRVFNTIYKTGPRQNFIFGRIFAYVFTLTFVAITVISSFLLVFGEDIIKFLEDTFEIQFRFLDFIVNQGSFIALIAIFFVLLSIYHFIPNVKWPWRYALPGTVFSLIGFMLVSQLFTIYISFSNRSFSNDAIGGFIVLIIWLYFNAMVLAIGAFLNVFVHDFREKNFWRVFEETREYSTYESYSDQYIHNTGRDVLHYEITPVKDLFSSQQSEGESK